MVRVVQSKHKGRTSILTGERADAARVVLLADFRVEVLQEELMVRVETCDV